MQVQLMRYYLCTTMSSFFNVEPVFVLVDPQLGVSAIALPLAHRWWQKADVGERMQGVLAMQFDGVFYTVHLITGAPCIGTYSLTV